MSNTLENLKIESHGIEVIAPIPEIDIGSSVAPSLDPVGQELGVKGLGGYINFFREHAEPKKLPLIVGETQQDVEFWYIPLKDTTGSNIFEVMRGYAFYSPIVVANKAATESTPRQFSLGMLSLNYDALGENRLPGLKVLTLDRPMQIVGKGSEIVPQTDLAVQLAGASAGEGPGIGSHSGELRTDYDHVFTMLGAVSLGKQSISEGGVHVQHAYRSRHSLDQKLTDGSLGKIFDPNGGSNALLAGYDLPIIFNPDSLSANDFILIPRSLAEAESYKGYGAYWNQGGQALERKLVAGMENVYNATSNASSQINAILEDLS